MKGFILAVVAVIIAYGLNYYRTSLPIVTGYAAKSLCTSVFLAKRDMDHVLDEDLGTYPFKYATFTLNHTDLSVTASILGFARSTAVYRDGLGATLINELTVEQIRKQSFKLAVPPTSIQDDIPWPMGNKIDISSAPRNIDQNQLDQAVNDLFTEKDPSKLKRTRALVIVYDDYIIAERYAANFSQHSKFQGWSMTKSIINALIGLLIKEKALNINDYAPVPEWNSTNDPRHFITIKHLLTQTSGLDFEEEYYSKSDATQMLFETSDMAAFAASHSLKYKPGTVCYYNSGTSNILSRIIRHTVGENLYHSFPYDNLFYKLGMNNFVMEVDTSGTFVGSSYSWGTARDWARFGLLYLNRGFYNGDQLLTKDWIEQSTTFAGSNQYGQYGFHVWLNTGKDNDSLNRRFPGVPTDMFYFSGFDGQSIFIIPSKKLVVVRLGLTKTPGGDYGADEFLSDVIRSLR